MPHPWLALQPGRPRQDEQQQQQQHQVSVSPARPVYRPSPLAAPTAAAEAAAAGDSPSSSSAAPSKRWPLRGYDLEEDLDALDEHEEMYGELEQVGCAAGVPCLTCLCCSVRLPRVLVQQLTRGS